MDFFRDPDFVFNSNHVFKSRYNGEDSYFAMSDRRYKATRTSMWDTNFIADARVATVDNAPTKLPREGSPASKWPITVSLAIFLNGRRESTTKPTITPREPSFSSFVLKGISICGQKNWECVLFKMAKATRW